MGYKYTVLDAKQDQKIHLFEVNVKIQIKYILGQVFSLKNRAK